MAEFQLKQGAILSMHHAQEQTGYLVSGHLLLTIGDVANQVKPGDSWCLPGDVEHKVIAMAGSVAIEVFSPAREDYLRQA